MIGRLGRRVLLPIAGGALAGASLPPIGWWPLAVVGLAMVAASLAGLSVRARLLTGLLAGVGQFFVALAWALQFNAAGYVVLALVEAIFMAVALMLVPCGSAAVRVPAFAGAITLGEWARQTWPFGGLPLGGIALGQVGGPLGNPARIGGGLLVVGVTALAGASLAALASGGFRAAGRQGSRGAALGLGRLAEAGTATADLAAGVAGMVMVVVISLIGLMAPNGTTPAGSRLLTAAIVQGGGRRGLDQLQVPPSDVLSAAVRATALVRTPVDLILWPEDVVAMNGPFVGSSTERLLAGLARSHRATLMAGVTMPVGTTRFRNEIVAFAPSGRLVAVFEKVHRVPFGEYVPWRGLFQHLANLRDVPRDAIPGTGSGLMTTPAGPFGVLVSYEVFFADRGRSGVRAGGEVILVPTNTSSYSNDQAPSQEIAASRLQAIEMGRFVLQAAPTGYSAVIDNNGSVLQRTELSKRSVLEALVPELSGRTWYEQAGDLPVLVLGAAAVLASWLLEAAARRRRGGGGG